MISAVGILVRKLLTLYALARIRIASNSKVILLLLDLLGKSEFSRRRHEHPLGSDGIKDSKLTNPNRRLIILGMQLVLHSPEASITRTLITTLQ